MKPKLHPPAEHRAMDGGYRAALGAAGHIEGAVLDEPRSLITARRRRLGRYPGVPNGLRPKTCVRF